MQQLSGEQFIGSARSRRGGQTFRAANPHTGDTLAGDFYESTSDEVDAAVQAAERAFQTYRQRSGADKALFLEAIGEEIMALGDALIERSQAETGLPAGRLQGERARTVGQLRLFAEVVREGSWLDARVDLPDAQRQPLPKPDIRSMQVALGPVAVFGASNFPLAFSVAGGDTASALAAGCPVIVKAHPAHPGTCELVARAIIRAAERTEMPAGVFSMVQGQGTGVGMALVQHPLIKAVGFTGSFRGGKALFDAAVRREAPIPVYAEMGSTNPIFILPDILEEQAEGLAQGLAASVMLGAGQFCTNPGLVVVPRSEGLPRFEQRLSEQFSTSMADAMLHTGIGKAYDQGVERLAGQPGVSLLAKGQAGSAACGGVPQAYQVHAADFLANPALQDEIFGPATLLIITDEPREVEAIAQTLHGHLTGTIWATEEELQRHAALVDILSRKVGRLLFKGFPTGVEVGHAMVHGGPFPATTDSRMTSVGTRAILRFTRPMAWQGFPQALLPAELRDGNPLGIWRLQDGQWQR